MAGLTKTQKIDAVLRHMQELRNQLDARVVSKQRRRRLCEQLSMAITDIVILTTPTRKTVATYDGVTAVEQ